MARFGRQPRSVTTLGLGGGECQPSALTGVGKQDALATGACQQTDVATLVVVPDARVCMIVADVATVDAFVAVLAGTDAR